MPGDPKFQHKLEYFISNLLISPSSLSTISTFHVQNKQLTGSLNSVSTLPLMYMVSWMKWVPEDGCKILKILVAHDNSDTQIEVLMYPGAKRRSK